MSRKTKLLKKKYLKDFLENQAGLIKSRIRFLSFLTIFIYLLATGMSFIIIPRSIHPNEVHLFKVLIIASLVIFLLTFFTRKAGAVKRYAYAYTILLLYIITKLNIVYPAYIKISTSTYLFSLFLVAFSIPWRPLETVNLTILHIVAYTSLFMYTHNHLPKAVQDSFDVFNYFGGFILLCMGFVLSFVVRRKEIARDLENYSLFKDQIARNEQVKKELRLASRVYETLVPQAAENNYFDIDVIYIPASYMSGDYAKYYFVDKDLLMFIVCDVTGHGVSAALLVNRVHIEFLKLIDEGKEPGQILWELNTFILKEFEGLNMYMSAFCGLVDLQEGELLYSNYGHPDQYLYHRDESNLLPMPSDSTLLGISGSLEPSPTQRVKVGSGDRVVLFTDGLLETKNKNDEDFGKERIEKFLIKNSVQSPNEFNQNFLKELEKFKSGDFQDDVFLINLKVKG